MQKSHTIFLYILTLLPYFFKKKKTENISLPILIKSLAQCSGMGTVRFWTTKTWIGHQVGKGHVHDYKNKANKHDLCFWAPLVLGTWLFVLQSRIPIMVTCIFDCPMIFQILIHRSSLHSCGVLRKSISVQSTYRSFVFSGINGFSGIECFIFLLIGYQSILLYWSR